MEKVGSGKFQTNFQTNKKFYIAKKCIERYNNNNNSKKRKQQRKRFLSYL